MSCFVHRIQRKQERRKALALKKQEGAKVDAPRVDTRGVDAEALEPAKTGVFKCSRCGNELFDLDKKFDSGTGFPSFWMHKGENVRENFLDTYGRERIQLLCNQCDLHLGHLFKHKKTPTGVRYCINADSIELEESR